MADVKISALTAASALTGTELVEVVQSGTNKKSTTQDIADLAAAYTAPSVYAVRLTQSGTGDPSGAASANTTGATVALARTGGGYASVTFSSAVLTAGKTIVQLSGRGSGGYTDPKLFAHQVASTTVINLGAFRASDQTAEDGWVLDLTVTIYP